VKYYYITKNERNILQRYQNPPENLHGKVHYTVCALLIKLRDLVTNIANAMEIELQLLELTGWRPFFM
jgi:hypothetical protein